MDSYGWITLEQDELVYVDSARGAQALGCGVCGLMHLFVWSLAIASLQSSTISTMVWPSPILIRKALQTLNLIDLHYKNPKTIL